MNADLAVSGVNGAVHTDGLPNVTVQGRISRQNFNARIGAGGAPIKVSGVNGSVGSRRALSGSFTAVRNRNRPRAHDAGRFTIYDSPPRF